MVQTVVVIKVDSVFNDFDKAKSIDVKHAIKRSKLTVSRKRLLFVVL